MLTIGDFSRLCRVTPRTLRHYDALGLLCPQTVGENGYRYYRQEQLSVLVKIQRLKGYGFSLGEIKPLLELEDSQLLPYLRQKRQTMRAELEEKKTEIGQIENEILRMEGKNFMENLYHVVLLEEPEQRVFSIRKTIGIDGYHELFNELRAEAKKQGLQQAGPVQMLYYDMGFDPAGSDVEAQMVVAQDAPGVRLSPAHTRAAVLHKGAYGNLHHAYEALCAWLGEHTEYRICGPAMDRYLNDPHNVSEDELLTGVSFQVEKVTD